MVTIVTSMTDDLVNTFTSVNDIGLDIEGVDLCRMGTISIIQLAVNDRCFLLDMLDADELLIKWLKTILESNSVVKIIHDCRMDADALKHILNIQLTNVHDTSRWHHAITGNEDRNLNTVLTYNALTSNIVRDNSVYNSNHAFWATRPLTKTMIAWASGDVTLLQELRRRQLIGANRMQEQMAITASEANATYTSEMSMDMISVKNPGRFIGPSGNNIRRLQKETSTLIYPRGNRSSNTFAVFYKDEQSFNKVKHAARG